MKLHNQIQEKAHQEKYSKSDEEQFLENILCQVVENEDNNLEKHEFKEILKKDDLEVQTENTELLSKQQCQEMTSKYIFNNVK